MKEAVAGHIRNGIRLGFGGADSTRIPVAVVHEIIPRENIRNYPNLTAIPHILVDEVVEQPFAATPGDSYGHYGPDKSHLAGFEKICLDFVKTGKKDRLQEYYDRNIFGCEAFEDFLNLQPSATLQEIIKKGNKLKKATSRSFSRKKMHSNRKSYEVPQWNRAK
jgi:hypothetical protein